MTDIDLTPETPKRSVTPILLAIVAVVVLAVGAVALVAGSDGDDVDPVKLLGSAPDAVREAGSARMAMTMKMGSDGFDMELTGDGVIDVETGAGTFSMGFMGQEMELRSDGSSVWIHMPALAQMGQQPWIGMPAEAFASTGQFAGIDSATGYLDAMRGIGGEIEEVGDEEVNGVDTTHYRVVVDIEDAIAAAPEAVPRDSASLEQLEAMGMTTMPMDVWITDDGLPVRFTMTMSGDGTSVGMPGTFDMEMKVELSDFGVPVHVEAPPEDQVRWIDDPSQLGELQFAEPPMEPAA